MTPSTILYIYVLAGQSNMAGRGDGDDIPASVLRHVAEVKFHYVCSFGADRGPPFSENGAFRSDGWETLRPCRKHPSTPGTHFGPELAFAARLSELQPDIPIAIIKHGRGGSRLATDWNPEHGDGRRFYDEMIGQVRDALGRLEESGNRYVIKGFVWMQGEGDTTHREYAESYGENMTNLIAAIREEVGDPELPVVIGRIGNGSRNPKMLYPPAVRQAQDSVARDDPFVAIVNTDDLPLKDAVHYDSSGLLKLGSRFAESMNGLDRSVEENGESDGKKPKG